MGPSIPKVCRCNGEPNAMVNSDFPRGICFCTTALGRTYAQLARLLAQDLLRFAPSSPLIVLTDHPALLGDCPNALVMVHRRRGVQPYHERRFAIRRGLALASTVIYLDADVRICAPVPTDLSFQPGLTARSCGSLRRHLQEQFDRPALSPQRRHKQQVIEKLANRAGVCLEHPQLKFINEFLFAITADDGRELEFLRRWGELAIYADTQGLHRHPTYAMALAAHSSGFPIHHSPMQGLDFFDDRIEQFRIRQGQSTPDAKAQYFQQQRSIERPAASRLGQLQRRLAGGLSYGYHRLRVQWLAAVQPSRLIDDSAVLRDLP